MFRNKAIFYGEELAPRPTPKLEGHRLSTVRDCLFNVFFCSYPPYWRPFFNAQPEDAPCRGDRVSLIKDYYSYFVQF